jgi:tyrosine-protein kinase Etk/Wzc
MNDNIIKNQKKEFTVLDYILILRRHKKSISILTSSVGVISIIIAFFVISPIFQSLAVVKTVSKPSGLSSLLGGSSSGLSDLGDLGDIAGGGSSSKELALFERILESRRNIEEVIVRFKLNDEWEYRYMQDAVKYFRSEIMDLNKDKIAGTLTITINDKDPQRAKDIADFMVSQLNKINIEMNILNAKNNREFIEQRFNITKENMKKAEDSLKNYQDIFGMAPDIQSKAVTEAEIKLEAELKTEEVKLELMKKIISPNQSEVLVQEAKINALNKQLNDIRNSSESTGLLKLKDKPGIVMNYLRLVRNVEIQNKIMVFLLPLFEQAKIEENRLTPSVIILDQPVVPERKAKPKRLNIILASIFAAFISMYGFYIMKEKWESMKQQLNSQV